MNDFGITFIVLMGMTILGALLFGGKTQGGPQ